MSCSRAFAGLFLCIYIYFIFVKLSNFYAFRYFFIDNFAYNSLDCILNDTSNATNIIFALFSKLSTIFKVNFREVRKVYATGLCSKILLYKVPQAF